MRKYSFEPMLASYLVNQIKRPEAMDVALVSKSARQ